MVTVHALKPETPRRPALPEARRGSGRQRDCLACPVRPLAFCSVLDADELVALDQIAQDVTLAAGQTLVQEHDAADSVYNVTAGTLRLFRLLADGRRQIVGFATTGDFLGLSAEDTHTVSAEAVTEVRLCRFSKTRLDRLRGDSPRIERRFLEMTREELRRAHGQMMVLGRESPMEKVASFLIDQARRAEALNQPGGVVLLEMTRGDIADYLGLTIETVSRTFTRLKKLHLIELPRSDEVVLADRERLEEMADGLAD